jgi:hypothetical protein
MTVEMPCFFVCRFEVLLLLFSTVGFIGFKLACDALGSEVEDRVANISLFFLYYMMIYITDAAVALPSWIKRILIFIAIAVMGIQIQEQISLLMQPNYEEPLLCIASFSCISPRESLVYCALDILIWLSKYFYRLWASPDHFVTLRLPVFVSSQGGERFGLSLGGDVAVSPSDEYLGSRSERAPTEAEAQGEVVLAFSGATSSSGSEGEVELAFSGAASSSGSEGDDAVSSTGASAGLAWAEGVEGEARHSPRRWLWL